MRKFILSKVCFVSEKYWVDKTLIKNVIIEAKDLSGIKKEIYRLFTDTYAIINKKFIFKAIYIDKPNGKAKQVGYCFNATFLDYETNKRFYGEFWLNIDEVIDIKEFKG